MFREIGAAGIANQNPRTSSCQLPEPGFDSLGKGTIVEDIASQNDIPAIILTDDIFRGEIHAYPVRLTVQRDRRGAERIDIGREDLSGAGECRGDRDETRPGRKIENPATSEELRIIQDVAGQSLTSGPCEGPEGKWESDLGKFLLGTFPEVIRLIGEMKPYLRNMGRRNQRGTGQNERSRFVR